MDFVVIVIRDTLKYQTNVLDVVKEELKTAKNVREEIWIKDCSAHLVM